MGWQRTIIKCYMENVPGLFVVWQYTGGGATHYNITQDGQEAPPAHHGHGSLLSLMQAKDLHFLCRERRLAARCSITTRIQNGKLPDSEAASAEVAD